MYMTTVHHDTVPCARTLQHCQQPPQSFYRSHATRRACTGARAPPAPGCPAARQPPHMTYQLRQQIPLGATKALYQYNTAHLNAAQHSSTSQHNMVPVVIIIRAAHAPPDPMPPIGHRAPRWLPPAAARAHSATAGMRGHTPAPRQPAACTPAPCRGARVRRHVARRWFALPSAWRCAPAAPSRPGNRQKAGRGQHGRSSGQVLGVWCRVAS